MCLQFRHFAFDYKSSLSCLEHRFLRLLHWTLLHNMVKSLIAIISHVIILHVERQPIATRSVWVSARYHGNSWLAIHRSSYNVSGHLTFSMFN